MLVVPRIKIKFLIPSCGTRRAAAQSLRSVETARAFRPAPVGIDLSTCNNVVKCQKSTDTQRRGEDRRVSR